MTSLRGFSSIRLSFPGALLGLFLLGVLGCGGGNPFDMAPVSGKVTYEDGSVIPAARIRVLFHPQCKPIDKKHARFAAGEVKVADGTFASVVTWEPKDGAVVGRHKVTVVSYDENGNESDAVPAEYRKPDTSSLEEVEIKSGKNRFDDIKVRKPS